MKQFLFLALTLTSLNSFSAIWDPHEKVILSILNRAERTPEARLNSMYSNIEQFRVDRANYEGKEGCNEESLPSLVGISKYTIRYLESSKCETQN